MGRGVNMALSDEQEQQQFKMITQMHSTMYGIEGGQAGLCKQFDELCGRVDKIEKTDNTRKSILVGIVGVGTVLYNLIINVLK